MLEQQYDRLPEALRDLARRLAGRWISGDDLELQMEGSEILISGLGGVLESVIGPVATRATQVRALHDAGQASARLRGITGQGRGQELAALRERLRSTDPDESRETLEFLWVEWVALLYWLLADVLLSILQEAAAGLDALEDPRNRGEQQ